MINTIVSGLPSTVEVGGEVVDVNTDFRHCLQASMLVDDAALDGRQKADGMLWHLFGELPDQPLCGRYLDAARGFLRLDELDTEITRRPRRSTARTFDWDEDQRRLVADFMREYRIDLTDGDIKLHWWLFLTLMEGLSPESEVKTAIRYRSMEAPKGATEEQRADIRALKKHYELAPRSREELAERERAIWGD